MRLMTSIRVSGFIQLSSRYRRIQTLGSTNCTNLILGACKALNHCWDPSLWFAHRTINRLATRKACRKNGLLEYWSIGVLSFKCIPLLHPHPSFQYSSLLSLRLPLLRINSAEGYEIFFSNLRALKPSKDIWSLVCGIGKTMTGAKTQSTPSSEK